MKVLIISGGGVRAWLVAALLFLAVSLTGLALSVAVLLSHMDVKPPAGRVARVCVEWGANWMGQLQLGLWWEASLHEFAAPSLSPNSWLHVLCGDILWLPSLPTRRTFIFTW